MQGFLSRDGMPPGELLDAGRKEVAGYGGELRAGVVTSVEPQGTTGFWVLLADGSRVPARRLLVATGLRDELPQIPGLANRWARDVLHCPYCHGWEVRDRRLGVLWNGPETVRYTQIVRQWADDVVLFAPPDTLTAPNRSELVARAVGVVEGEVAEILVEDDRLTAVRLTDAHAFVAPTLLTFLALSQKWFADLQPWVDPNYSQDALFRGGFSGEQWAQLAVTTLVWLVVPLAAGVRSLVRSEVK